MLERDFYWGAFGICLLLMAVVHSIAESSLVGLTGILSGLILFVSVVSAQISIPLNKSQLKR